VHRLFAPLEYTDEVVTTFGSREGYLGVFSSDPGDSAFLGEIDVDPADSTFYITLNTGLDFAIINHARVMSVAATGVGDVWLSFTPFEGGSAVGRFFLPESVVEHSLALTQLDQNGVPFNTPLSEPYYVALPSGFVPKATALYNPAFPYWIVDLTNRTKTIEIGPDLRNATWVPDYTQYPLVQVNCYLEGREKGHKFTVYSWAAGGPVITASVAAVDVGSGSNVQGYHGANWATYGTFNAPGGSARLSFSVGEGMSFYIKRDADGVRPGGTSGTPLNFVANSQFSLNWSLFGVFPDPPNRTNPLQTVEFRFRSERAGHEFTVWMSDGYSAHFIPGQYGETTIDQIDYAPVFNPLMIMSFIAQVDPGKAWWVRDDTAGEVFPLWQSDNFDGWTPQFEAPPGP
jgi:hypothetical protein